MRIIIRPWRRHESERIRTRSTSIKAYRRLIFRRWKRRGTRRLIMIDFEVEDANGNRITPLYRKRAYHQPGERKMLNTFEQSLYGPSDR